MTSYGSMKSYYLALKKGFTLYMSVIKHPVGYEVSYFVDRTFFHILNMAFFRELHWYGFSNDVYLDTFYRIADMVGFC